MYKVKQTFGNGEQSDYYYTNLLTDNNNRTSLFDEKGKWSHHANIRTLTIY